MLLAGLRLQGQIRIEAEQSHETIQENKVMILQSSFADHICLLRSRDRLVSTEESGREKVHENLFPQGVAKRSDRSSQVVGGGSINRETDGPIIVSFYLPCEVVIMQKVLGGKNNSTRGTKMCAP